MSDPNPSDRNSATPAVPDPLRAGARQVRWQEVAAGFGIACALMFGIRLVAWGLGVLVMGTDDYAPLVAGFIAWYVPIPVLIWLVWRNAKRGRKGRAIGMAIYAGLSALLITACWAAVGLK